MRAHPQIETGTPPEKGADSACLFVSGDSTPGEVLDAAVRAAVSTRRIVLRTLRAATNDTRGAGLRPAR